MFELYIYADDVLLFIRFFFFRLNKLSFRILALIVNRILTEKIFFYEQLMVKHCFVFMDVDRSF